VLLRPDGADQLWDDGRVRAALDPLELAFREAVFHDVPVNG
jgi:hypothetical protein